MQGRFQPGGRGGGAGGGGLSLEDVPRSSARPGRWVLSCMWHPRTTSLGGGVSLSVHLSAPAHAHQPGWAEMGQDAGCRGPTEELPQPPFAGGRAAWCVGLSLEHFGPGMCKAFPVGSQVILTVTHWIFILIFQ